MVSLIVTGLAPAMVAMEFKEDIPIYTLILWYAICFGYGWGMGGITCYISSKIK